MSSNPGKPVPVPYPYENAPVFPGGNVMGPQPEEGYTLHACMGLNSCKGQDRFGTDGSKICPGDPPVPNACAGQGYCSTAGYKPPPGKSMDHTCHVQNDCKSQGGCGLYGTAEEMDNPGDNACKSLGSCATPINAERFSTNGHNREHSVWLRAREVFQQKVWPGLRRNNSALPAKLPPVGGKALKKANDGKDIFKAGPAYLWVSSNNAPGDWPHGRAAMTSCGFSTLSGAGGCGGSPAKKKS